jgi:hypothetical protein
MGVGGQHHFPAALPPGKNPGTHIFHIYALKICNAVWFIHFLSRPYSLHQQIHFFHALLLNIFC